MKIRYRRMSTCIIYMQLLFYPLLFSPICYAANSEVESWNKIGWILGAVVGTVILFNALSDLFSGKKPPQKKHDTTEKESLDPEISNLNTESESSTTSTAMEALMLDVADSYYLSTFAINQHYGRNIPKDVLERNCKYSAKSVGFETPLLVENNCMLMTTNGIYNAEKDNQINNSNDDYGYQWDEIEDIEIKAEASKYYLVINSEKFVSIPDDNIGTRETILSLIQDIRAIKKLKTVEGLSVKECSSVGEPLWLIRKEDRVYHISSREELCRALKRSFLPGEEVTSAWEYKDLSNSGDAKEWKSVGEDLYEQLNINYRRVMIKRKLMKLFLIAVWTMFIFVFISLVYEIVLYIF